MDKERYEFCWIVDFPMYEIGEESGELEFCHNPFSMPKGGMETMLAAERGELDPLTITGLTTYLSRSVFGTSGAKGFPSLPTVDLPLLDKIPFLGAVLNGHSLFVYLTWLFVLVLWVFIYKTPYGFWLRASGEKPETLRTAGIEPEKMKWLASILCGVLCALAGAHLSLGYLNGTFAENMSNSRGYIAFACVIFGAANPAKAYLAALMFGFFDAIGLRLQDYVSSDLTGIIPYAITIIMMVYVVVNAQRRRRHAAQQQLSRRARS